MMRVTHSVPFPSSPLWNEAPPSQGLQHSTNKTAGVSEKQESSCICRKSNLLIIIQTSQRLYSQLNCHIFWDTTVWNVTLGYHSLKYDNGIQKAWLSNKNHLGINKWDFLKLINDSSCFLRGLHMSTELPLLIKGTMNSTDDDNNKEPFEK